MPQRNRFKITNKHSFRSIGEHKSFFGQFQNGINVSTETKNVFKIITQ